MSALGGGALTGLITKTTYLIGGGSIASNHSGDFAIDKTFEYL